VRVVWTLEAQQDRAEVWDYIAADNPRAAARMDEIFSDAAARLTQHPMLGKPGTIPGTRELIPARQLSLGVPDRRRSGVDTDTGSYGPPVAACARLRKFHGNDEAARWPTAFEPDRGRRQPAINGRSDRQKQMRLNGG